MTQPAKTTQEPSMEEILASIRRIIADDDSTKPAQRTPEPSPPAPPPPAVPPQPVFAPPPAPPPRVEPEPRPMVLEQPNPMAESADILDLTESMAAAPPPPPLPPTPSAPSPQFRTIDGGSDVGFDESGERGPMADDERRLMSNTASAAVDSAFNSLAQTVLMQNARTLEDLVREMLRPMLKTWLDDNLPGMVERLVRAEIERVSRGRPS
jgi:cell pole-organizing protein PopZ